MSSLPPRQLCIAGALCIAVGVGSVTEMIAELITHHAFQKGHPGVFGMLIGYGILIGNSSARKWALFFAGAGFVIAALFAGGLAYHLWSGGGRVLDAESIETLIQSFLAGACSLYVLIVLKRSVHREWFATVQKERAAANYLTCVVVAVTAVLQFSERMTEWRAEATLEQVYPFHVSVVPFNAESGEGLTSLYFLRHEISPAINTKSKFPKVDVSSTRGKDGKTYVFSGIAAQPFQLTLHSDGFQEKTLGLTKESKGEIRFPMQPLIPSKPKPKAEAAPAATRPDSD